MVRVHIFISFIVLRQTQDYDKSYECLMAWENDFVNLINDDAKTILDEDDDY